MIYLIETGEQAKIGYTEDINSLKNNPNVTGIIDVTYNSHYQFDDTWMPKDKAIEMWRELKKVWWRVERDQMIQKHNNKF